jgi:hypothetical protein
MDSAERDSSGKVYIKAAPTTIVVLIANTETSYLPVVRMVEILATASVFAMALVMLLVFLVCVLGVWFGFLWRTEFWHFGLSLQLFSGLWHFGCYGMKLRKK